MALGKKFAFGKNAKQQVAAISDENMETHEEPHEGMLEEAEDGENQGSEEEEGQGDNQEVQEEYEHVEEVAKNNHTATEYHAPARVKKPVKTAKAQSTPISQPVKGKQKHQDAVDDRITLSAKIDRLLHFRMKYHSFKNQTNIAGLVEGWIEQHCPEL